MARSSLLFYYWMRHLDSTLGVRHGSPLSHQQQQEVGPKKNASAAARNEDEDGVGMRATSSYL